MSKVTQKGQLKDTYISRVSDDVKTGTTKTRSTYSRYRVQVGQEGWESHWLTYFAYGVSDAPVVNRKIISAEWIEDEYGLTLKNVKWAETPKESNAPPKTNNVSESPKEGKGKFAARPKEHPIWFTLGYAKDLVIAYLQSRTDPASYTMTDLVSLIEQTSDRLLLHAGLVIAGKKKLNPFSDEPEPDLPESEEPGQEPEEPTPTKEGNIICPERTKDKEVDPSRCPQCTMYGKCSVTEGTAPETTEEDIPNDDIPF